MRALYESGNNRAVLSVYAAVERNQLVDLRHSFDYTFLALRSYICEEDWRRASDLLAVLPLPQALQQAAQLRDAMHELAGLVAAASSYAVANNDNATLAAAHTSADQVQACT